MSELLTIGHSTHELDDFVALLRGAEIACVADIRRYPGSRRNPQYSRDELPGSLAAEGIAYEHLPELGGRRSRAKGGGALNTGWRVAAFAAYADHLRTEEFARGRARLSALAQERRTAIMCAEAPWWRCHRRLVADAFHVSGWTVLHVMPDGRLVAHEPPDFMVVGIDGIPAYPAGGQLPLLDG